MTNNTIENCYKVKEIKKYILDHLKEHLNNGYDMYNDIFDLHHTLFNTDYYIIGIYKCEQWLSNKAMHCIQIIQDYETEMFGNVSTDLGNAEQVVNMYTYIIGEELLYEMSRQLIKEGYIKE